MTDLTTDDWYEPTRTMHLTQVDAGWDQVEAAIRALDQSRRTEVSLSQPVGWVLFVGGGNGRYRAFVQLMTVSDERYYTLFVPGQSAERGHEVVVTGGQPTYPPMNQILDLATTLKAARTFFETGRPDPDLPWIVRVVAQSTE